MLHYHSFVYSRALDQALSWLIKTERLRSYSVVPAIVVQNKRTSSDIWYPFYAIGENYMSSDKGSKWRDYLVDSTLERMEMVAESGL